MTTKKHRKAQLKKSWVINYDYDIEYEVRIRRGRNNQKVVRQFSEWRWNTVLTTPSLDHALFEYSKQLAKGKKVKVFKYTIEVTKEELFGG
jgi:hypothetical protein